MQKYPKGTLVEIVKHEWRTDLIGKRFVVDETKHGNLMVGRSNRSDILENILIYMSPFLSTRPGFEGHFVGLPEDCLRPVQDHFPEDEGFEFDSSKTIWKPTVIVEDGEALVV